MPLGNYLSCKGCSQLKLATHLCHLLFWKKKKKKKKKKINLESDFPLNIVAGTIRSKLTIAKKMCINITYKW